ncbi:hypothetical protein ACLTEW_01465 [Gordonia lacunae]|uniref:hypothetical protein n=1 Tax=Gordonia lacunae TaxID=417102 RepID=UPI0039E53794
MTVSNENIRDQIGRLARELHGNPGEDVIDPEGMLLEVTEAAVRVLPGVDMPGSHWSPVAVRPTGSRS